MRAWLSEWWPTLALVPLLVVVTLGPPAPPPLEVERCPGIVGLPCGCGKDGCAVPCGACCPVTPCPVDDPTCEAR